jgi:hypothetical protein
MRNASSMPFEAHWNHLCKLFKTKDLVKKKLEEREAKDILFLGNG